MREAAALRAFESIKNAPQNMDVRPLILSFCIRMLYLCIIIMFQKKVRVPCISVPFCNFLRHTSQPEHRRLRDYPGRELFDILQKRTICWLIVAISQTRSPLSPSLNIVAQTLRYNGRDITYMSKKWKDRLRDTAL